MSGIDGISASSNGRNQNQRIHSHMVSQLQSFDELNPEIYKLTAGMEMMAASYPSSNDLQQQNSTVLWRGFFNNNSKPGTSGGSDSGGGPAGPSTSKELNATTSSDDDQFYHHDLTANEALMVSPPLAWFNHHNRLANVDDPNHSLRSRVFPCEGNERPSQGLSLSLSSSNPSRVTLQSFELRQHPSSGSNLMQEQYFYIRNSRYLRPAQELLNEFCSLGLKQTDDDSTSKIIKLPKTNDQEDDQISDVSKQSLYSLDLLELQIRKTKLIQMLEEVVRMYKHYCGQMKAVASSFEAVAGNGAAAVYSAMASRSMSRHFRCLKDGIVTQMKATKKAIEDKNTAAPGYTMKGETPRLRLLDQKLRQQKALQQMSMMEAHPWRPQRGLPERSVSALRAWLFEHFLHPYPTDVDKHILSRQTGLSRSQVSNWFINARVRLWKPMVEEMYSAELNENSDENLDRPNQDDQKPTLDRTPRKDSDPLSSILNNNPSDRHNSYGAAAMELDFSSYGGRGGVSLTLGLHQHSGNGGVGVGSSSSSSLFYSRDQMEDCQTVHQYSLLESDQNQNLPYRNLMGAQLLHDLAG